MEHAAHTPETATSTDGDEPVVPEQQRLHEPSDPLAVAAARNGNNSAIQRLLSEPEQNDLLRVQALVRQAVLLTPAQHERIETDSALQRSILDAIQAKEEQGYCFDRAPASLELLILRALGEFEPQINVVGSPKLFDELGKATEATVRIRVNGAQEVLHEASNGRGPIDALFLALKKCLQKRFPRIASLKLVAFGITMVSAGRNGTDPVAEADVLLGDGAVQWRTMASGRSIIQASSEAVIEALEFGLLREKIKKSAKPE